MSDLEKIGVRAVVENIDGYQASINKLVSSTNKVSDQMKQTTQSSSGLDKILGQVTSKIGSLSPEAAGAAESMGGLAEAAGVAAGAAAAAAAAIAVVVGAIAAFVALAQRGAGYSEIETGFGRITAAADVASKTLLTEFRDAVGGTVSDMELMTIANNSLIGVGKDFQKQFGENLPQVMKIAKAVAEATGKDTIAVYDQMTESIRRGQTRMMMASGILINQKLAFETYAKSIGKSVEQMTLADRQQAVLNATLKEGKNVLDTLGNAAESNADKSQKMGTTITNTLDSMSEAVQPLWGIILDVFNAVVDGIAGIIQPIATYMGAIISLVADGWRIMAEPIIKFIGTIINVPQLISGASKGFFEGGFRMIGALARGILQAANQYVFPAIITIAQGIADFLVGMSPPPKGPLSLIDQGGANTMEAWITGFTGVSMDPVEQVAAQVANVMGPIARENLDQVNNRLKQLDVQLAPFSNRLKIVSAQFDALKPAQEAAFRAIDRQIAAAQKALESGDQAAADTIQRLDAQRGQLQEYVDLQQEAVDNAQIQLSFAQAQQAQERAMLGIRKDALTAEEKATGIKAAAAPKAKKAGGGGGGAGAEEDVSGGGLSGGAGGPGGFLGDIEATKTNLMANFSEGLGTDEAGGPLQLAQQNVGKIGDAFKKLEGVDIGSKLQEKFSKIFDPMQDGSITNNIGKWFIATFSPDAPDSIVAKIKKVPDDIGNALGGLAAKVTIKLTEAGVAFNNWAADIVDPSHPTSIPARFTDFITVKIPEALKGLSQALTDQLNKAGTAFDTWILSIVDPAQPLSLPARFKDFVTVKVPETLGKLGESIDTAVLKPVRDKLADFGNAVSEILTGQTPNVSLPWYWDQLIAFITGIPDKIAEALGTIGEALKTALITPVKAALQGVLDAIHGLIAGVIDGLKRLVSGLPDIIKNTDIAKSIMAITIPEFKLPGMAQGGIGGPGLMMVGERGPELISTSEKTAVFPNNFVTALDRLTSTMQRAYPAIQSAASYQSMTSIDRSVHATFNGVDSGGEAVRKLALMQAYS